MKISIIGFGAFGYAVGVLLASTHPDKDIHGYDVIDEIIDGLAENNRHPYFHKDIEMPENVFPNHDSGFVLDKANVVILAVPAQYMRDTVESIKNHVPDDAILLNVSKALEKDTNERMSEVIQEALGKDNPIATISGGMLAGDVIHGNPVGAEIACPDQEALKVLESLFRPSTVHVDMTTDIVGVELGGAFKNVIAIGAGIVDGLEFGTSAKAFYIAKALEEIEKLSVALGAEHSTFHTSSNSWIGDLMTSCFGSSRNRYFGELLGKGMSRNEAVQKLKEEKKHAEGLVTLELVAELMDKHKIDAPFTKTLYEVVYEGANPHDNFKKISLFQA